MHRCHRSLIDEIDLPWHLQNSEWFTVWKELYCPVNACSAIKYSEKAKLSFEAMYTLLLWHFYLILINSDYVYRVKFVNYMKLVGKKKVSKWDSERICKNSGGDSSCIRYSMKSTSGCSPKRGFLLI